MVIEYLENMVREFDQHPKSDKFAKDLAYRILFKSSESTTNRLLFELALLQVRLQIPFKSIPYSTDATEPMQSLAYLLIQYEVGEGCLDGEGLNNYYSKALKLGWSTKGFLELVREMIEAGEKNSDTWN